MFIQSGIVLSLSLSCLLVVGCATRHGSITKAKQQIAHLRIELPSSNVSSIEITKSAQSYGGTHKPVISEKEKSDATTKHAALNRVFQDGFRTEFPISAAKRGLVVTYGGDSHPVLRLAVVHRQTTCNIYACMSLMRIRGDVFLADGSHVWHFIRELDQGAPNNAIRASMFLEFSRKLLDQMQSDGLIERAQ